MRYIQYFLILTVAVFLTATGSDKNQARAADQYILGISGVMSGPGGSSYLPMVEAVRVYFEKVNDQGGINGRKVKLIIRDSANDPLRAVADLKSFADTEGLNAVIFPSTSATVGAYTKESRRISMPTIYVNACYPPATPPRPNPEFFCPGISTLVDAFTIVDLLFEVMKGKKITLGFVTSDVPGARIAAQKLMAPYAAKKGAKVVGVAVAPVPMMDLLPITRGFKDKGVNAIISYTYTHHMLATAEAVGKLNYDVTYLMAANIPGALTQMAQLKNPNIYAMDHFSLVSEDKPVHKDIVAAAKKYGYDFPVSDIRFGWRAAMVTEAALKACGWPCSREKLVGILNALKVDDRNMVDLNGGPVTFTKTNHTSPSKAYRVYSWNTAKNALTTSVDWFVKQEMDWAPRKK